MSIPADILASLDRILGDVDRNRRFEQAQDDVRAVREWLERIKAGGA
jgi:hypothetical protein